MIHAPIVSITAYSRTTHYTKAGLVVHRPLPSVSVVLGSNLTTVSGAPLQWLNTKQVRVTHARPRLRGPL